MSIPLWIALLYTYSSSVVWVYIFTAFFLSSSVHSLVMWCAYDCSWLAWIHVLLLYIRAPSINRIYDEREVEIKYTKKKLNKSPIQNNLWIFYYKWMLLLLIITMRFDCVNSWYRFLFFWTKKFVSSRKEKYSFCCIHRAFYFPFFLLQLVCLVRKVKLKKKKTIDFTQMNDATSI